MFMHSKLIKVLKLCERTTTPASIKDGLLHRSEDPMHILPWKIQSNIFDLFSCWQ